MKMHGFINSQCHHITEASVEQREQQSIVTGDGPVMNDPATNGKKSLKVGGHKRLGSSVDKAKLQDSQADDVEINSV